MDGALERFNFGRERIKCNMSAGTFAATLVKKPINEPSPTFAADLISF
jgi:hypothetical protein